MKRFFAATLMAAFAAGCFVEPCQAGPKAPKTMTTPDEAERNITLIEGYEGMSPCWYEIEEKKSAKKLGPIEDMAANVTNPCQWHSNDYKIAMSPDGASLAVIDNYGRINIFDTSTDTYRYSIGVPRGYTGKPDRIVWGSDNFIYLSSARPSKRWKITPEEDPSVEPLLSPFGSLVYIDYMKAPAMANENKLMVYESNDKLKMKGIALTDKQYDFDGFMNYTPAGKYIYYAKTRDRNIANTQIWRYDMSDGSSKLILGGQEHGWCLPSVSPDGKRLAVVADSYDPVTKRRNLDIFVCNADGSGLRQLTYHPADDTLPVWDKTGRFLYFISHRGLDYTKKYEVLARLFKLAVD